MVEEEVEVEVEVEEGRAMGTRCGFAVVNPLSATVCAYLGSVHFRALRLLCILRRPTRMRTRTRTQPRPRLRLRPSVNASVDAVTAAVTDAVADVNAGSNTTMRIPLDYMSSQPSASTAILNTMTDTMFSISTKASRYGCIWIQFHTLSISPMP